TTTCIEARLGRSSSAFVSRRLLVGWNAVATPAVESPLTAEEACFAVANFPSGPFQAASGSQRSSASRPAEAGTDGVTATRNPDRTQARWLGAKRGASKPSL